MPDDDLAQGRVHGEAASGQLQGRREHVAQRERAERSQGGDPGVEGGRDARGQEAVAGDEVDAGGAEPGDGGARGRRAQAADGHHAAGTGIVDEDGHLAADAVVLRFEHGQGQPGGHARVDGVAAALEHAHARRGGQVVARGDHAVAAHDDGARGEGIPDD